MRDLFERENDILKHATDCLKKAEEAGFCTVDEYRSIVKEYKRMLKQLQQITKISDRTTIDLNETKLALMDKVHYDGLTGIYNRRYLDERLGCLIEEMAGNGDSLSLLMVDVDFFKRYNDTYGHGMGDDCLRAVAQVLQGSVRCQEDFAARYGGEEFVVVLPHTCEASACTVAGRILESVRHLQIPHEKNEAADWITVSVGVTAGRVKESDTADQYLERADQALYRSKQSGRNKYTYMHFREAN